MNGKTEFYDSADANATQADIKRGKTAYVKGKKVTGDAKAYVQDGILHAPDNWLQFKISGS